MAADLRVLISEIFRLNDEVNAMLGVHLEQRLGPPASAEQIKALQTHLGVALPPSYVEFLSICNGWVGYAAKVHLLSVEQQIAGEYASYVHDWKGEQWAAGEAVPVEAVVFGIALNTNKARLFDTNTRDAQGEMEAIWWEDEELHRYENLIDMFEQYLERLRLILAQGPPKPAN